MGEFVPGYEASAIGGLGAPKGTSPEIISRLNAEVDATLADSRIKGRLADLGIAVVSGSPTDFGRLIVDETAKWGKVVKFANIKPE
jgi:tripartite-type tricarboxylate transporter receptor subunit TctC